MTRGSTQGALAAELIRRTEGASGRARALAEGVDDAVLRRKPAGGGWSAGQVLEHLVVSEDSYLHLLPGLLARAANRHPGGPDSAWAPSLAGGWLARSLAPGTRRMPAPPMYRPGPEPRPRVLAEFLDRQARMGAAMEAAAGLEWRRVRLGSPVLRLVRMNLGDAFAVNTVHVERHLGQLERVLAEVAPAAGSPAR